MRPLLLRAKRLLPTYRRLSRPALALSVLAVAALACGVNLDPAPPAPTAVPLPVPLLWRATVSSSVISPPAVAGNQFFLVDVHQQIQARDLATGAQQWAYAFGNALQPRSPLPVDAGTVFGVGLVDDLGLPTEQYNKERPKLVALNVADGRVRWETWLAEGYSPLSYQPPAAADGVVYFEANDQTRGLGLLRAARSATGESLWQIDVENWLMAAPLPVGDRVFVAVNVAGPPDDAYNYTAGLWALAAATGDARWQVDLGVAVAPLLAADGARVYAAGDDGMLYAFDAATGDPAWQYDAGAPLVSPLLAEGALYLGTQAGRVIALDAASGDERWAYAGSAPVETRPAFGGGQLYYGSADGYLRALNAATGAELWAVRNPISDSFEGSPYQPAMDTEPVVAGGVLLYFNIDTLAALQVP